MYENMVSANLREDSNLCHSKHVQEYNSRKFETMGIAIWLLHQILKNRYG
jgi:hypothetical protein